MAPDTVAALFFVKTEWYLSIPQGAQVTKDRPAGNAKLIGQYSNRLSSGHLQHPHETETPREPRDTRTATSQLRRSATVLQDATLPRT